METDADTKRGVSYKTAGNQATESLYTAYLLYWIVPFAVDVFYLSRLFLCVASVGLTSQFAFVL